MIYRDSHGRGSRFYASEMVALTSTSLRWGSLPGEKLKTYLKIHFPDVSLQVVIKSAANAASPEGLRSEIREAGPRKNCVHFRDQNLNMTQLRFPMQPNGQQWPIRQDPAPSPNQKHRQQIAFLGPLLWDSYRSMVKAKCLLSSLR